MRIDSRGHPQQRPPGRRDARTRNPGSADNLQGASTRVRVVRSRDDRAASAIGGGTAAAFDDFVGRRYASLVRFGYVLTGSRTSAEDLVQTALFRTYRRWTRLDDQVDPFAYVRRAMVNAHISWMRVLSSGEQLFSDPPERAGADDGHDLERLHMWGTSPRCRPGCGPFWCCASTKTSPRPRRHGSSDVRSAPSRVRPFEVWPGFDATWPSPTRT